VTYFVTYLELVCHCNQRLQPFTSSLCAARLAMGASDRVSYSTHRDEKGMYGLF